ncbi:hypothetical protein MODO_3132 [Myroides odoratimimus]|uniref:hypothetical protein n=1 Tax=Myroides odoratimimus TaxID=76832 RepID=UPI00072B6452|nr:hypothetical protein [Myroides odoratimimus]GAQ15436.1 hypothetical protein MODO_3132 [Myroides odoratimimus]STZ48134.1 Uncharacterised protein [Myroides odoratimimus]
MQNLKRYLSIVFMVLAIMLSVSCGSNKQAVSLQPTVTESVTTTVEEVKRDTTLVVEADRSSYVAELAIQGNKIVVKDANIKRSKNKVLQPPKVQLVNNKLTVDCTLEAQSLFFEWRDKYIKENKVKEIKIPVPVPLELSWWQSLQIWMGRVFMFLIGIGGVGYFVRKKVN